MANNPSEVKVAVQTSGQIPHLFALDQTRPLAAIIQDLCTHWQLKSPPQDYALQFDAPTNHDFVTERNRGEIKNGTVMKLTSSPARTVQIILEKLEPGCSEIDKTSALQQLSELSVDYTFMHEFISRDGLKLLISMIENGSCVGDLLAYCLKSFVELMDHGTVTWDVLESKFIKAVCNVVTSQKVLDATSLQSALEILESVVSNGNSSLDQDVTPESLVHHLQSGNAEVQTNAVALINALFMKAQLDRRKKMAESLQSRNIRGVILQSIIHKTNMSQGMQHQLYVLQSLLFSLLDERRHTAVDLTDQVALTKVHELRKIAFDMEVEAKAAVNKRNSHARDFKKLGFQNPDNPLEDFTITPPGGLALDNMVYFAETLRDNYTKVVLENSCRTDDHDLPFARASIELINVLCEILKVGDMPTDDGVVYYPMFFTHDHAFEEFYCICIQLLNKTWREMKASSIDFAKVFAVLREQVTRALQYQPQSFDQFRSRLVHLAFQDITNIWQEERQAKEHVDLSSPPIQELKKKITPEIIDLIKRQRLNHLVNGMGFNMKLRRTDKFFYCRLSPNHKVLHYGDCSENATPSIDQLTNKLAVVDIKELLTGKDCPHVKDKNKTKLNPSFAFSIVSSENINQEPVNFVAANEETFCIWTDAINALLGKPMVSPQLVKDLDTLLSMEIKLRLLDTEGITIPKSPPVIPPDPPNYDFVVKK
jgi:engulfment/cell motility protein 1